MAEKVDFSAFISGFLAEADELLQGASAHLACLEQAARDGQPHPRGVRELFRALHTVKGLAAMIGVEPIADVAHCMESVLRAADRIGGHLSDEGIELLAQGLHAIDERMALLARRKRVPPAPAGLIEALAALAASQANAPAAPGGGVRLGLPDESESKLDASEREQLVQGRRAGQRAVALEFVPSPEKAARGLNITTALERLCALGELVKVMPRALPGTPGGLAFTLLLLTTAGDESLTQAVEAAAPVVDLLPAAPGDAPVVPDMDGEDDPHEASRRFVRVDVVRLDEALERLSALVVTRFRLTRACEALAAGGADPRALGAIIGDTTRQLRDLREAIMRARMISLAETLQRLPLLVRGLTRNTDKAVALSIDVGDAELDKAVAERLFPALLHLVRNAVDHAIEPRDERRRRGKPEAGRLTITRAGASGTHLTLTVADDGRGIDRELVARKAGRPVPATGDQLLALIATPGLSTRDQASRTSGRGMGMDIVKRVVDSLGGSLSLETAPGQGTRLTLRVPLSMTIVDAFSFTAAAHTLVAPVAMVEAIIDIDPARVARAPAPRPGWSHARLIERRGEPMPLVALDALLRLPGQRVELPRKALIVRRHGEPIAYGVERMLGQQEVVVRPLEDPLVQRAGITGSTDLGDGRPTLVLDLVALGKDLSLPASAGGTPCSTSSSR